MLSDFFGLVRWEWAAVLILLVVALVFSLVLEFLSFRKGQREEEAERAWKEEARQIAAQHAALRAGAGEVRRRGVVIADALEHDA